MLVVMVVMVVVGGSGEAGGEVMKDNSVLFVDEGLWQSLYRVCTEFAGEISGQAERLAQTISPPCGHHAPSC